MSAEDTVRNYKSLALVERAFRCLKGVDLPVRPINHSLGPRFRAHIFLCTLAYYAEWHMRKALAPLLFEDEELEEKRKTRDPVAPAPSTSWTASSARPGMIPHPTWSSTGAGLRPMPNTPGRPRDGALMSSTPPTASDASVPPGGSWRRGSTTGSRPR